jgi:ABC-2 type transport system permease protein
MFAVMKREYLQGVRRKAFIIMTILLPFLMAALVFLPALIMEKGAGQKRIAVLDGTGRLQAAFTRPNEREAVDAKEETRKRVTGRSRPPELPTQISVEYVDQSKAGGEAAAKPYLDRLTLSDDAPNKLEGVFVIPAGAVADEESQLTYYSRSATEIMTQERMSRLANRTLQSLRLSEHGIRPELVNNLLRDVPVEAVQLSRSGEKKTGGELNFIIAFIFGAMLVLPSFVYGQDAMRGIVQEKTDRVVEVLISSVTPMQLLSGKIMGVAAVGLTQIFAWLLIGALVGGYGLATAAMAGFNLAQFLRPIVALYFFVFFILAYLTYVCIYAIGGAICNSEREAQQFIMPIMMFMMMPWFLMMPIVMNPDAPFAVAFSLSPIFAPITMFVRTLVTEPPLWHLVVSILVSIATIVVFFWITAKIFRIGILSYGKRPTVPELWRWLKAA